MDGLVLGPLLRYVGQTEATLWVETERPCEVEVLGCRAATFHVERHHYALVHVEGLEPGSETPYEVSLDGERVWPLPGDEFPAPRIRTWKEGRPVRIAFGSCRVCAPHREPWSLRKDRDERGREVDALRAMALRMSRAAEDWPDELVLLGDQVYADEVSPKTLEYIRSRRDTRRPPGETIANFAEYTRLYRESWSEPVMRWLLSTVPSSMIFDDHDVIDDWNTSASWVRDIRAQPWWEERIVGALMSYWVYQHIGNLAPEFLDEHALWHEVLEADDAGPVLRAYAHEADREVAGKRWSYRRDIGPVRLVMIDSRCGRVLDEGARSMVDEDEWRWIEDHAVGGHDHLLLGTSLPVFLVHGLHYLEAWNERLCAGAWGGLAVGPSERLRQGVDLEHWAAFERSFRGVCELLREVASGRRGKAPASIAVLSGDVHHAYLAEIGFPPGTDASSAVYQAVCSPFRNPLDERERRAIRIAKSRGAGAFARRLARLAGVQDPPVRWRNVHPEPWFDNQVGTLVFDGRSATLRLEKTTPGSDDDAALETVFEHRLVD